MESFQQLRGEGRADAEVLLYLNFSFQHVKTRNCFIPLLICFLHCSTSQCTLPLLPAALDVFLTILWRICASFRASKNSKTLQLGHSTQHQELQFQMLVLPRLLMSTCRSSPSIPHECQNDRREGGFHRSSPHPPAFKT